MAPALPTNPTIPNTPRNPFPPINLKVLGSVTCTPATAAIGDSVCVEVRAPDGHAYDNTESGLITINGVPGSTQYLVWNRAGKKTIVVAAGKRGAIETLQATVEITVPADRKQPPLLQIQTRKENPTALRLALLHAEGPKNRPNPLRQRPHIVIRPRPTPRMRSHSLTLQAGEVLPAAAGVARAPTASGGGATAPLYTWELGGALMLGSSNPVLEHDVGAQLNPNRAHTVFHVKATLQEPGAAPRVIRRSVSVANPYFLSKQRGVLQPPLVDADLSALYKDGCFRASFSVRNPEAFAVTLTSQQIELAFDEGANGFELRPAVAANVLLKANGITRIEVAIPKAQLPAQAVAFSVHYRGVAPKGLPVRVTAHFDVPEHLHKKFVVNAAAQAFLDDVASRQLVADPKSISLSQLTQLSDYGMLPAHPAALLGGPSAPRVKALALALKPAPMASPMLAGDPHAAPPPALEGALCDPWNMPDNIPAGMFCVPTQETAWKQLPARFMNAKKGDLILSPGDGGMISAVLQSVTPAQRFSHSGIMTRNYDEITHSTASEERLASFIEGDGARPDALKYLWPGVITQTIEHAVDGGDFRDPETGIHYTIGGFGTRESKMDLGGVAPELVPAMVVKPDPLKETLEIRQTLHGIADFAAQQAGKSHYRFFCYTKPEIGLSDKAPASAKWAANTFPSVCSSLIWMAVRQSGVPMEGALEQSDLAAGGQRVASTKDGLYLYQADERAVAAEVLYHRVKEVVLEAAGSFADFLTDVQDDTANQMLNSFASDWSETEAKDSDAWRNSVDANAVSPDNLTLYDAPLFGYMEPLIYRPERWEQVTLYKWKKIAQFGSLSGVVKFAGKAAAGVEVRLSQNHFTHTGADGSFALNNVPAGQVHVVASLKELSCEATVTVAANQNKVVALVLEQPSHLFRRITVDGWMRTTDYQFAASDPTSVGNFHNLAQLGPGSQTHAVKIFDHVTDGDTMGRLILTFDLLANDAIQVKTTIRCYDSGAADTDDYEERQLAPFVVNAGASGTWWAWVEGDNYAEAHFTLTNKVDPS